MDWLSHDDPKKKYKYDICKGVYGYLFLWHTYIHIYTEKGKNVKR